jgi:predicted nucleic acid-binding protein
LSLWIVDASVALAWFLKDEDDRSYALEVLSSLHANEMVVPSLWVFEFANGLLSAHRRNRLSKEGMFRAFEEIKSAPIVIEEAQSADAAQITELALSQQLTVYDAAYLELALRRRLPIATKDAALVRAMAALGVDIVAP